VAYEGYDSDDVVDETSQSAVDCIETSANCQPGASSVVPCCAGDGHDDALRIAWRYKNLHLPVE